MQFWASFDTSFLYYSRKWGIISQSWKWGTYPPVPAGSDAYGMFTTLKYLIPYESMRDSTVWGISLDLVGSGVEMLLNAYRSKR